MKRFLSALLALCLLITFLPTGALAAALAEPSIPGLSTLDYTTEDVERMPATDEFSYEFLPAGETWKTLAAGVAPATFKEVSYELADGVVVLEENSTVSEKIASAGQLIAGSAIQDKSPEKIKVATVIRLINGPIAMLPCVSLYFYERCKNCNEKHCGLHDMMIEVRDATLNIVENRTLKDLIV